VTHDVTHLTCADFLKAPGVQTPVIVRFSTVVHERGSPGESSVDLWDCGTPTTVKDLDLDLSGSKYKTCLPLRLTLY